MEIINAAILVLIILLLIMCIRDLSSIRKRILRLESDIITVELQLDETVKEVAVVQKALNSSINVLDELLRERQERIEAQLREEIGKV